MKKIHRVIKFNQKDCLKSYNDTNAKLRQKAKNNFEKYFFKLINNAVFGKTLENGTKYRDQIIILQTFLQKTVLAREMKNTQILMNKPVYLGLLILDLHKTVWCTSFGIII